MFVISKKKARTLGKKTTPQETSLKICIKSIAQPMDFYSLLIPSQETWRCGTSAQRSRKNQTKPKVSRILSNVCNFSRKKARTSGKKTTFQGMVLNIYSLAYGFLFFVNSISGNLALKKNQTKPKVSRLLSNVCYFQKRKLGLWKRKPHPWVWV